MNKTCLLGWNKIYLDCDKDMNFGRPGMECYRLNCALASPPELHHDLKLPASKTVKKYISVVTTASLWYFCYGSLLILFLVSRGKLSIFCCVE